MKLAGLEQKVHIPAFCFFPVNAALPDFFQHDFYSPLGSFYVAPGNVIAVFNQFRHCL